MNKKFLSVVLFGALMAGSSVTFTGCIDNDEPAGIENLRGAKAELLRAKVAVEAANAAYTNACAAEKLAMAKKEEAIALEQQYIAEAKKMANELQAVKDEKEKAELQAKIEEINAKLEQNKLNWEAELLTSKTKLAEAQKAYEDAMKALELSKTYLSQAELKALEGAQGQLDLAKKAMENSQTALEGAYDTYKNTVIEPENYLNETTLQEALVDAQTTLEKATNKLAVKKEALAALESNDAYAAWVALKAKYNQKIDSLNAVLADKKTAEAKIIAENHTTIDAAKKAIAEVRKVETAEVADKNAEFVYSKSIVADELDGTKFTGIVSLNAADNKVVANWKGAKVLGLAETNKVADNTDYTQYATLLDNTFAFADGDKTAYKNASDQLDAAIKEINRAKAAIPTYDTEKAEANKKAAQTALDNAKKAKTTATTAWTNSIADWNKVVAYTSEDADKKAVTDAKATYDAAMKTANALTDVTEKAKAQVKAQNAFADAIVKYYNAAAPLQLATQKVSIKLTVGNKTTWVTKTVKEWLSDSENKDVYLTELITYFGGDATKLWTVSTVAQTSNDDGSVKVYADAALSTLKKKEEIKAAWNNASIKLFGIELGTQGTDEGRITEPTTAEINAVWTKNHSAAGACGDVLTAEENLKTATENVGKAAEFDKIVAQLTAWKTVMSDAKTAYMTGAKATLDALTAAQKAVTDKVATPIKALKMDATEAMKDEISAVINAIDGTEIKEYETVIEGLKKEIGDKKGVAGASASTGLNLDVETASGDVLEAEKMIELFKAGNLKEQYVIQWAQEKLDLAKADYATKVETFNYWNGKLADLMKTLYGKAAE